MTLGKYNNPDSSVKNLKPWRVERLHTVQNMNNYHTHTHFVEVSTHSFGHKVLWVRLLYLFCVADIHEVSVCVDTFLWVCVFGGLRCHFIVIWYMMEHEESHFPYLLKHTMGGQRNPDSPLDVREGGQLSINGEISTAWPVVRQKMCSHVRVLWNVNNRVQLCSK